jgi:hypothetical protein
MPAKSTPRWLSLHQCLPNSAGKFTIASASYAGDKSCAGKAYFKYYGVSTIPNRGGPDPGHFLAPWFKPSTASGVTNGVSAVMLSTAKILGSTFYHGNHLPLSTVKGANSTEIPGNVRSTKLTLRLTALANGYLRMPWTWSDAGLYSEIWFEGYGSDDRNLMRILVDGACDTVSLRPFLDYTSTFKTPRDSVNLLPWPFCRRGSSCDIGQSLCAAFFVLGAKPQPERRGSVHCR